MKVETDNKIKELGLKVREIRLSKGLTQLELSIDSCIPLSQISAIESGKINTTVRTLIKLSDSLNIQLKDLFSF